VGKTYAGAKEALWHLTGSVRDLDLVALSAPGTWLARLRPIEDEHDRAVRRILEAAGAPYPEITGWEWLEAYLAMDLARLHR